MEYERMTLLPSKRKENVRNWPGRAFSRRPSVTTKRKVFASEVCCATLANLKTSGPLDGEVAETAPTGAFTVPAGVFDSAPARGPPHDKGQPAEKYECDETHRADVIPAGRRGPIGSRGGGWCHHAPARGGSGR